MFYMAENVSRVEGKDNAFTINNEGIESNNKTPMCNLNPEKNDKVLETFSNVTSGLNSATIPDFMRPNPSNIPNFMEQKGSISKKDPSSEFLISQSSGLLNGGEKEITVLSNVSHPDFMTHENSDERSMESEALAKLCFYKNKASKKSYSTVWGNPSDTNMSIDDFSSFHLFSNTKEKDEIIDRGFFVEYCLNKEAGYREWKFVDVLSCNINNVEVLSQCSSCLIESRVRDFGCEKCHSQNLSVSTNKDRSIVSYSCSHCKNEDYLKIPYSENMDGSCGYCNGTLINQSSVKISDKVLAFFHIPTNMIFHLVPSNHNFNHKEYLNDSYKKCQYPNKVCSCKIPFFNDVMLVSRDCVDWNNVMESDGLPEGKSPLIHFLGTDLIPDNLSLLRKEHVTFLTEKKNMQSCFSWMSQYKFLKINKNQEKIIKFIEHYYLINDVDNYIIYDNSKSYEKIRVIVNINNLLTDSNFENYKKQRRIQNLRNLISESILNKKDNDIYSFKIINLLEEEDVDFIKNIDNIELDEDVLKTFEEKSKHVRDSAIIHNNQEYNFESRKYFSVADKVSSDLMFNKIFKKNCLLLDYFGLDISLMKTRQDFTYLSERLFKNIAECIKNKS